jgi:hypothetical protein
MSAQYYTAYSDVIGSDIEIFVDENDSSSEYTVTIYRNSEDDMAYVFDYQTTEIPSLDDVLSMIDWM